MGPFFDTQGTLLRHVPACRSRDRRIAPGGVRLGWSERRSGPRELLRGPGRTPLTSHLSIHKSSAPDTTGVPRSLRVAPSEDPLTRQQVSVSELQGYR